MATAGFNGQFQVDDAPGGSLTDYSSKVVSFDSNLPQELLDSSVLGTGWRQRTVGLQDFECTVEFLADATITAALDGYLGSDTTGSIDISPQGTGSGTINVTGEVKMEGLSFGTTVDGLVTLSVTFRGHGAMTVGTN